MLGVSDQGDRVMSLLHAVHGDAERWPAMQVGAAPDCLLGLFVVLVVVFCHGPDGRTHVVDPGRPAHVIPTLLPAATTFVGPGLWAFFFFVVLLLLMIESV
jgi:hypothetical protein